MTWLVTLAVVACFSGSLDPGQRVVVLAALVTLLGLPHGALDPLVARAANRWRTSTELLRHLLTYTGLALAVVLLWMLWPVLSLMGFLLISAWHFGDDWRVWPDGSQATHLERLAMGCAVVGAPVLFHPERVSELFGVLVGLAPGSGPVEFLISSWSLIAAPAILAVAWLVVAHTRSAPSWGLELVGLVAAAWWFPPLVFFVLYFCFLHSPRHLIGLAKDPRVGLNRTTWIVMVLLTLVTVLAGISAFLLFGDAIPVDARLVQIVFVALAALTVPHMWLVERYADGCEC